VPAALKVSLTFAPGQTTFATESQPGGLASDHTAQPAKTALFAGGNEGFVRKTAAGLFFQMN
jgi:hypothetical protein